MRFKTPEACHIDDEDEQEEALGKTPNRGLGEFSIQGGCGDKALRRMGLWKGGASNDGAWGWQAV
ncbi:MAG: hypothetical protein HZB26_05940 [Candidatus Hydrogenedentes bacterium]|nr:hypothetical protein [Candidatus Hydrogenedentota bacterium]